jgi:pimeloyl-ACP methyl ester carboxylesterase
MAKLLTQSIPKLYGQLLNLYTVFNPNDAAKKAFKIFCKVRKGRVLTNQEAYLNSAKHKVHDIAEHSVQTYKWEGTRETVLLVHGWESNAWRWHRLIQKLTDANYEIIAFDAPGHGNSSGSYLHVPLYAEVLQFMIDKYNPKFLIGHSVGGMTILYNENLRPSPIVKKIVTIGSPSEFHEIIAHFQTLLGFNGKVLRALDTYIHKKFGFTIREFSTSRFARTNRKKGLLFHDKFDKITPYHASEQVSSQWENSILKTTEGLGHSMHQDEVNDQIVAFLES